MATSSFKDMPLKEVDKAFRSTKTSDTKSLRKQPKRSHTQDVVEIGIKRNKPDSTKAHTNGKLKTPFDKISEKLMQHLLGVPGLRSIGMCPMTIDIMAKEAEKTKSEVKTWLKKYGIPEGTFQIRTTTAEEIDVDLKMECMVGGPIDGLTVKGRGTIGCFLKSNLPGNETFFAVTCAHVVSSNEAVSIQGEHLGNVKYSIPLFGGPGRGFKPTYDIALIEISNDDVIRKLQMNDVCMCQLSSCDTVTANESVSKEVWKLGAQTGRRDGTVENWAIYRQIPIQGERIQFVQVMKISGSRTGPRPFSIQGDSGSIVMHANNPVGMVFSGPKTHDVTYAFYLEGALREICEVNGLPNNSFSFHCRGQLCNTNHQAEPYSLQG